MRRGAGSEKTFQHGARLASSWEAQLLVNKGVCSTLRHGPPPARARGREAVGGAEPWPQVHPGVVQYAGRARAVVGLEWRAAAAGW